MVGEKKAFSLPDMPRTVRVACLFVCGKAYPLLFIRDAAQIGTEGKGGQIRFSRCFNEVIKNSIAKEKQKHYWDRDEKNEEEFNFFKIYYTLDEFFDDVIIESYSRYYYRWLREDNYLQRELKQFFTFYEGKDFTQLHLRLDSPIALTLFKSKEGNRGSAKTEYEFLLNPNLYELGFMRIVPGEIVLQELDMFLGNVLVKDIMPPSYQSDLDKLTAHGFDPKTSFRNIKDKS